VAINVRIRQEARVVVNETIARAWIEMVAAHQGTMNVLVDGTVLVYEDGTEPPAQPEA
jgi:hypothetical protein